MASKDSAHGSGPHLIDSDPDDAAPPGACVQQNYNALRFVFVTVLITSAGAGWWLSRRRETPA